MVCGRLEGWKLGWELGGCWENCAGCWCQAFCWGRMVGGGDVYLSLGRFITIYYPYCIKVSYTIKYNSFIHGSSFCSNQVVNRKFTYTDNETAQNSRSVRRPRSASDSSSAGGVGGAGGVAGLTRSLAKGSEARERSAKSAVVAGAMPASSVSELAARVTTTTNPLSPRRYSRWARRSDRAASKRPPIHLRQRHASRASPT